MSECEESGRAGERKKEEWKRRESVRRMHSSNSGNEDAHSFACHPPWLEKYRPMRLEDILGQEKVCERVRAFLRRRTLPNLSLIHISEPTRPY